MTMASAVLAAVALLAVLGSSLAQREEYLVYCPEFVVYNWTARRDIRNPDGFKYAVVTVDDHFPPPPIRVRQGDRIQVNLRNELPNDAVSVHWHGIEHRKPGEIWMDGGAYVTQCPIMKEEFRYEFDVEEPAGTYWWHGHYDGNRVEGFSGAFIIDPPRTPEECEALANGVESDTAASGRKLLQPFDNSDGILVSPQQITDGDRATSRTLRTDVDTPFRSIGDNVVDETILRYYDMLDGVDGEYLIMAQGWSHFSMDQQWGQFRNAPLIFPNPPQSILVNGRGHFDMSIYENGACDNEYRGPVPGTPLFLAGWGKQRYNATDMDARYQRDPNPVRFDFEPGRRYLLRLLSLEFYGTMKYAFEGHNVTIVAADGRAVQPYDVPMVSVEPGQRYDVIFTADQEPGAYRLLMQTFGIDRFELANNTAILCYQGAEAECDAESQRLLENYNEFVGGEFNGGQILDFWQRETGWEWDARATRSVDSMPADVADPNAVTQELQLYTTWIYPYDPVQNGITRGWYFQDTPEWNTSSYNNYDDISLGGTPMLAYMIYDRLDDISSSIRTYRVRPGDVVDLIIHGLPVDEGGTQPSHAFHLHGYHFWYVGYGPGQFDREQHADLLNFDDPPYRDTAMWAANGTETMGQLLLHSQAECVDPNCSGDREAKDVISGWVYLRVRFRTPGLWFFHCHIGWHTIGKQGFFFIVEGDVPDAPDDHPRCGLWQQWHTDAKVAEACNK